MALLAAVRARRGATVADAVMALALYSASDLDNRRQLAVLASPALDDAAVLAAWLACAATESDSELRDLLVGRLFACAPGQLPAESQTAWIDLLLTSLDRETLRHGAVHALRTFVTTNPALADRLVAAAGASDDPALRDHLDLILLDLTHPTAAVAAHWRSRLAGSGLGIRLRLVDRLCEHGLLDDDDAVCLLDPGEPQVVRERVLRHWLDRGQAPMPVAANILAGDASAVCRSLSLDLLATSGGRDPGVVTALLSALRSDPLPALRTRAALAIAGWGDADPAVLDGLFEQIRRESDRSAFAAILQQIGPVLVRQPALRIALAGLLRGDLEAESAIVLCGVLAPCARGDAGVRDALLAVCESPINDRVRTAALAALSGILVPDPALEPAFQRAMRSNAAALRRWGAQGFLRLDILTIDPLSAAAATDVLRLLPSGGGYNDRQLREQLARKLAVLRPLPVVFAELADRGSDDDLRAFAISTVQAATATTTSDAYDWDDALERIQVRNDAAGLFPALLIQAQREPAAAGRVLHAAAMALLTTGLANAPCTFHELVPYLVCSGVMDEVVVRALAQRLHANPRQHEDPSPDLAAMRAHPRLPEVLGVMEAVLPYARRIRPGLLRDLLCDILGDEATARTWFHDRLLAVQDASTAEGLLELVERSEEWSQPDPILLAWHARFSAKPGADRLVRSLETLCKRWKLALPTADAPPPPAAARRDGGLLDD
jgi:hypothetical protein